MRTRCIRTMSTFGIRPAYGNPNTLPEDFVSLDDDNKQVYLAENGLHDNDVSAVLANGFSFNIGKPTKVTLTCRETGGLHRHATLSELLYYEPYRPIRSATPTWMNGPFYAQTAEKRAPAYLEMPTTPRNSIINYLSESLHSHAA